MARQSLLIANPYDNNHIGLINSYEKEHNLNKAITERLCAIRNSNQQQEYESSIRKNTEFEQFVFIKEGETITSGCELHGYRDIKSCYLTLLPANSQKSRKALIQAITQYSFQGLGMEEIFISINSDDNSTALAIIESGYEDLGEESGITSYMADKNNYLKMEGLLDGNNKKY